MITREKNWIFQKMIYRSDLRANPETLYIFGDNEQRAGSGGQAGAMRGEPNAVGVRTKRAPGIDDGDYWSDDTYEENVAMIEEDLVRVREHIAAGGLVVYPYDGIGTGLSALPVHAPKTYEYLRSLRLGGYEES